ncbi:MAG TPA: hypothetical protein VN980_17295 [Alphaproteobacteria bacterium]|nr:hypothetical protein [Alphaproteobacteria bacterium]
MTIFVTLDIFSGRPNPRWTLDSAAASSLFKRLAALVTESGSRLEPPGLGYRGLLVESEDGPRIETPIRIYRGTVYRGIARLADPGRALERWLLATGKDAVPSELRDALRAEFDAR